MSDQLFTFPLNLFLPFPFPPFSSETCVWRGVVGVPLWVRRLRLVRIWFRCQLSQSFALFSSRASNLCGELVVLRLGLPQLLAEVVHLALEHPGGCLFVFELVDHTAQLGRPGSFRFACLQFSLELWPLP